MSILIIPISSNVLISENFNLNLKTKSVPDGIVNKNMTTRNILKNIIIERDNLQ